MPTSDEDVINTQIFDTDNTGLIIAQDILVTAAVTGLVQDAVENTIYHLGGKQSLKGLSRMAGTYVTKETSERIQKMTFTNLANKATQNITKIFSGKSAAEVSRTTGKALGKQAGTMIAKATGKQAVKAAGRSAAITTGACTLGPAGCAAGSVISMAVFIADMAFTVYSTILDIQDSKGLMIIWHKDFVDKVSEDFRLALEEGYASLGVEGLMEEEIAFYPEMFVYDIDENNIPYMKEGNEWAVKYTQYFDEYIKNTANVRDGWRDRLNSQTLESKDLITVKDDEKEKLKTGVKLSVMAIILVLLSLILISIFILVL
jgi:hypothetical protein